MSRLEIIHLRSSGEPRADRVPRRPNPRVDLVGGRSNRGCHDISPEWARD